MNNFILIYITNPSKEEAKKIVRNLLGKKLIACGNIFSSDSLYFWDDEIKDEEEFVLIVKTLDDKFEKVKLEIEKMHSYDIPCIIKIPVSSNDKYFDWVKKEIEKE